MSCVHGLELFGTNTKSTDLSLRSGLCLSSRADSHHMCKDNQIFIASFDNATLKEAINLNVWHSSFRARASFVT